MSGKTLKWTEPILEGFFTTYGRPQLTIPRGYLCISAGCVIKYFITRIRPPRAELSLLWIRWLWPSCKLVLTNLIVWGALGLSKRKALARNLTRMVILSATGFGCSVRTFPRRRQHWEKVWLFGRGEFNYHWGRTVLPSDRTPPLIPPSLLSETLHAQLSFSPRPPQRPRPSGRADTHRSDRFPFSRFRRPPPMSGGNEWWNEMKYTIGILAECFLQESLELTNNHYTFFLRGRHKPIYLLNSFCGEKWINCNGKSMFYWPIFGFHRVGSEKGVEIKWNNIFHHLLK